MVKNIRSSSNLPTKKFPVPMEGSIHEIIYLDGTRQIPPIANRTNVISSSPEPSPANHPKRSYKSVLVNENFNDDESGKGRAYKSVLTNKETEMSPDASSKKKNKTALFMSPKAKKVVKKAQRKKPKWEPNDDTSFLDSSDSEDIDDLEGFGMKRKSSHNTHEKVKIAKEHWEHTKLATSQTSKRAKFSAPKFTGGRATSDRESKSSDKKSNNIKTDKHVAVGTDEIQCLGVFSPGEFKSPVAKMKNSLLVHDKSCTTPPRKLDQGSADFQSPATYGSKLKKTHISDIGNQFYKYEGSKKLIDTTDLRSYFGEICNKHNKELVSKIISYRNRIKELTYRYGGPQNVKYSHRRFVFSKASVTVWNAYEDLGAASIEKLTEYYMVSLWTAQQIVHLQTVSVKQIKENIIALPVTKRKGKGTPGKSKKKIDEEYEITML